MLLKGKVTIRGEIRAERLSFYITFELSDSLSFDCFLVNHYGVFERIRKH